MSIKISTITSSKKEHADILRAIANLIENNGKNPTITIDLKIEFNDKKGDC